MKIILQFAISCEVQFGQTVGIIGSISQFGNWQKQSIFPLHWTEGHIWKGQMNLEEKDEYFECKFVVFHQNATTKQNVIIQMEVGANRQYNFKNTIQFPSLPLTIQEQFNFRKITFSVFSQKANSIHLTGNLPSLKEPHPMVLQNQFLGSENQPTSNFELFTSSILVDMRVQIIRYHFIKNNQLSERGKGRYLLLDSTIQKHLGVQYSQYQNEIFKEEISCDSITEDLIVGAFINNSKDIINLYSQGVTAILSLQTSEDMERKQVNFQEINRICKSKGIIYINFPIRDNDPNHYIQRAPSLLEVVQELFNARHKIYIHCTSGIGRAPQTALLHLVLHKGMSLQKASELLFSKRSVSSPNHDVIISIVKSTQKNKQQKLNPPGFSAQKSVIVETFKEQK